MRIFLDTNIITELLFERKYVNEVAKIIQNIENGKYKAYISSGSFYTLTYLIDCNLKKDGITNPKRIELLKTALTKILTQFSIVELSNLDFFTALNEQNYIDLEDSYQFRAALKANCDTLVTINTKDFFQGSYPIKILNPEEFVKIYEK